MVDADNTLWGGVVGEDGVENLEVDSDYPGIVHTQLQRQLLRLKGLGILLCAVTKNNEEDFRAVFAQRAMPLRLDDFVAYRSNWSEKSENIRDLAATLNLGLDSFVFLDDNPFEIEEVRARLPGVECHLFDRTRPEQALTLLDGIASCAPGTSPPRIWPRPSSTAARRSGRSCSARPPRWTTTSPPSRSGFMSPATTRAPCAGHAADQQDQPVQPDDRRYTEDEVATAMQEGGVYAARVVDRFGDMGIVGVAIVRGGELETFLMSCRASGRRIEAQILRHVCHQEGDRDLKAQYRPSAKNRMVETFLDDNGFEPLSAGPRARRTD